MRKKLLAFVLCCSLASTALVGCGGSDDKKETKKTETSADKTADKTTSSSDAASSSSQDTSSDAAQMDLLLSFRSMMMETLLQLQNNWNIIRLSKIYCQKRHAPAKIVLVCASLSMMRLNGAFAVRYVYQEPCANVILTVRLR